ncbi:MAG: hypothetical protein LBK23_08165 [Oscillospiraceae bacterium]|jgi:vacuolar-type H+-ATPase subunit I/STV1|nr:hypothetical protein [Oscillospiraceae bacterium]
MNNSRRKLLSELKKVIDDLIEDITVVQTDEEDYRDNIPENLQNSEKYATSEAAISEMQFAIDYLQDAGMNLDSACE